MANVIEHNSYDGKDKDPNKAIAFQEYAAGVNQVDEKKKAAEQWAKHFSHVAALGASNFNSHVVEPEEAHLE